MGPPPPLGAALRPLPGREVARDGALEGGPEGRFAEVEGLMCTERVTLGVMPLALFELPPAQSTGQTCSIRTQAYQTEPDAVLCQRKSVNEC